jgi:hypothetical protein
LLWRRFFCNFREDKCESGEVLLASLEKEYESKISKGNDPRYKYKLCCAKDIFLDVDAYWANMQGEEINKTDKGDTVRLIVDYDIEGIEEIILFIRRENFRLILLNVY